MDKETEHKLLAILGALMLAESELKKLGLDKEMVGFFTDTAIQELEALLAEKK